MRCLEVQHGQNPVDYTYLLFKSVNCGVKQSNAEAARHTHMI